MTTKESAQAAAQYTQINSKQSLAVYCAKKTNKVKRSYIHISYDLSDCFHFSFSFSLALSGVACGGGEKGTANEKQSATDNKGNRFSV